MLATTGYYSLIAAFVLALYAFLASIFGARLNRPRLVESAERAVVGVFFFVVFAAGILAYALFTRDFSFEYVAHYTSSTLPTRYALAAFWGGQAGSMLFWVLILQIYTIVALLKYQNRNRALMPYVTAVLMGTSLFFLTMLIFAANPFHTLSPVPLEGQSLNPLLQNYWMVSHPPSLYTGYIGLSIPYAFGMAALITRRLDVSWIKTIRKWTLFAWLFLTLGILQGSYWAYIELGWGGYWAWDPVENASFMPWLAATAFLHSVMIQEKKGMLKTWNTVLVFIAFTLSIFGTFLTRSGVVSSVHSFAQSPIGTFFAVFLAIQIAVSVYFVVTRKKELAPEARLESFVSRESSFLFNNVFFLVICLAILCGTTFPIVSEWVTGSKVTVSAPFFNKVVTPFAIGLMLLTGICPLIAWRRAGLRNLRRNFMMPLTFGAMVVVLLLLFGMRQLLPVAFFFSSAFVLATVYLEFSRGTQARMAMVRESIPVAFLRLVDRNKRRYGGFIIHTGVAILFVGIAASSFFKIEKDVTLKSGESFSAGDYTIHYRDLREMDDPHKQVVRAGMEIYKGEKSLGFLYPERHFYKNSDQPTTEVALLSLFKEDVYLILTGWDDNGKASFKIYINPLVGLIWRGGLIMALGGLIVLLPDFKAAFATSAARETLPGAQEAT